MDGRGEGRVDQLREQVAAVLAERALRAEDDDVAAELRDRLAHMDDAAAKARDGVAATRDDEAAVRERTAYESALRRGVSTDPRPGSGDRLAAASDRTSAMKDRGRSRHDRKAAQQDRTRAAADRGAATAAAARLEEIMMEAEAKADDATENMLIIGQAQGRLMQARGITAAEALLELFRRASDERTELRVAAHSIVAELAMSRQG